MEFKQAFLISLNVENYKGNMGLESLYDFKYEESNVISTEGFVDAIKHIIEKIKEFFSKFTIWLKKTWPKILIYLNKVMSYFDNTFQNFNYIKNKYNIIMPNEIIDYWSNNLGQVSVEPDGIHLSFGMTNVFFKNLNTLVGMVIEDKDLRYINTGLRGIDSFDAAENSLNNENDVVVCITYCLKNKVKFIASDENGNLYHKEIELTNNDKAKKFYNFKFKHDELIKSVSDTKSFRQNIDGYMSNYNHLQNIIDKTIKSININNASDEDKRKLKNLFVLSSKAMVDMLYMLSDLCSVSKKYIKMVVKEYSKTTLIGYEWLATAIKEKNSLVLKSLASMLTVNHGGLIKIEESDLYNIKIVTNGKVAYLDTSDGGETLKTFMATTGGACAIRSGQFAEVDKFSTEIAKMSNNENNEDVIETIKRIALSGLILIDQKIVMDMCTSINREAGTNIGLKFIIYHELGHVVTNQNETPLSFSKDYLEAMKSNDEDLKYKLANKQFTESYISGIHENLADAYAIVNTNTSVDDLVKWRFKVFELAGHSRDNYEGREEEMKANIKKQIANLGSVAKMDLIAKIKSVYKSK